MGTDLLTVRAVADRLRLTPDTVRVWISKGRLRALRLPSGRLRIEASDVERLLRDVERSV